MPEQFLTLTERQLDGLLHAIDQREARDRYTNFKFHASLHGRAKDFPTLEEVLGLPSKESESQPESASSVDADAAKILEEHALAQLARTRGA